MNNTDLDISIVALESSLDAKIERYFDTLDTDPDVLKQLLADKRSENTRRTYERDVNDFLQTITKIVKGILKKLPKKDYPVLITRLFFECWLSYSRLQVNRVQSRDCIKRDNESILHRLPRKNSQNEQGNTSIRKIASRFDVSKRALLN